MHARKGTILGLDCYWRNPLLDEAIEGTVQTVVFADDGSVQKIQHKEGNTLIREDVFTFTDTAITEVRTLNTGGTLTLVTNLETLATTVTYVAA